MSRPSNADLYNKTPEIDPEAQPAIDAIRAQYPDPWKFVSAKKVGDGYDVAIGHPGDDGYVLREVSLDATFTVTNTEDRPDVAPGHKPDKPHGKPEHTGKPEAGAHGHSADHKVK